VPGGASKPADVWRYVHSPMCVARGDAQDIGAVWRYTWSSRLPYRLTFDMMTTASQRPHRLEGVASGASLRESNAGGSHAMARLRACVTTGS